MEIAQKNNNKDKFIKQILVAIIILLLGFTISIIIYKSKKSVRKHVRKQKFPKVFCIRAIPENHNVVVQGFGNVTPVHEIDIVSEVSGKILKVSKNFVDGGSFEKGEILVKVDPEDYKLSLSSAEAKVKDSESKYALAKEESYIAKEEWYQVHGKKDGKKITPLVAKEPQLAAAYASLKAYEAEYKKIKLQLERCTIRAPFNGRVSLKKFDKGQYISKGQALGTIFSTDSAEITVSLKNRDLYWLDIPGFTTENKSSKAIVKANVAGYDKIWNGVVDRALGKIDANTRLIKIAIIVKKPYSDFPPLAAGLFTEINIQGRTINNVFSIPTESIRDDNIIWVINNNNTLMFKKISILRRDGNNTIVNKGLKKGDFVVISNLKLVANGMKVNKVVKESSE